MPFIKKKYIYIDKSDDEELIDDSLYIWCEDPYITTIDNLRKIESKLKKFTLCPENQKYLHIESGINYGEVGFPTRLALNNFKFYGLPRDEHFIFLDQNTIGNKNK